MRSVTQNLRRRKRGCFKAGVAAVFAFGGGAGIESGTVVPCAMTTRSGCGAAGWGAAVRGAAVRGAASDRGGVFLVAVFRDGDAGCRDFAAGVLAGGFRLRRSRPSQPRLDCASSSVAPQCGQTRVAPRRSRPHSGHCSIESSPSGSPPASGPLQIPAGASYRVRVRCSGDGTTAETSASAWPRPSVWTRGRPEAAGVLPMA